jgi:TolA-binding protein
MSRRTSPHRFLLVAVTAALLPGCFLTRAVGLGPDPDPRLPVDGEPAQVTYDKARKLFEAKEWNAAGDAFGKIWRDDEKSELAADARYYEAECRFGMEKWNGAFELYKGLLKNHPLSPHAARVERRLYDMGVYLIYDGRQSFLDSSGEGVEVLEYLVQAFPNGDLADDALMQLADHEWRSRRPQDAVVRLHDLVDRYPGSEWAYEARLRLAKAYRDMNRGDKYDADALRRAAAHYHSYIELVTADPKRAAEYAKPLDSARIELREVEETLGRKGLAVSDFYLYDGRVQAARAELRNVIRLWPTSGAATEARRRLGESTAAVGPAPQKPPEPAPPQVPAPEPEPPPPPPPAPRTPAGVTSPPTLAPSPTQPTTETPIKTPPDEAPPAPKETPPKETPPEKPPETPPETPPEKPPEAPPEKPPEAPPEKPPETPKSSSSGAASRDAADGASGSAR